MLKVEKVNDDYSILIEKYRDKRFLKGYKTITSDKAIIYKNPLISEEVLSQRIGGIEQNILYELSKYNCDELIIATFIGNNKYGNGEYISLFIYKKDNQYINHTHITLKTMYKYIQNDVMDKLKGYFKENKLVTAFELFNDSSLRIPFKEFDYRTEHNVKEVNGFRYKNYFIKFGESFIIRDIKPEKIANKQLLDIYNNGYYILIDVVGKSDIHIGNLRFYHMRDNTVLTNFEYMKLIGEINNSYKYVSQYVYQLMREQLLQDIGNKYNKYIDIYPDYLNYFIQEMNHDINKLEDELNEKYTQPITFQIDYPNIEYLIYASEDIKINTL